MRGIIWRCALVAASAMLLCKPATAQGNPPNRGLALGAGLGFGRAGMAVGQQSNHATGIVLHGRIGARLSRRLVLLLAAEIQPFEVENPARAEAYSSFYLLPSLQIYLARAFYVRAGIGKQFRSWSGKDPVTDSDSGGATGLSLGREFRLSPRLALVSEIVAHWALIEAEGNVTASFYGVQFIVSR